MADENKTNEVNFEEVLKMRERIAELKAKREMKEWPFGITSLMDAMTILLIFLLITLTSDPLNIKQDENLLLAKSTVKSTPQDAIPITITKRSILVDKQEVVNVDCKIGDARCDANAIKRRTFCDTNPAKCSDQEKKYLNKMRFYVDKTYLKNGDENNFLIVPLYKVLKKKAKIQREQDKALHKKWKGIVNIICDRDIPFKLVIQVVHTAGMVNFTKMRFAVIYTVRRY